MRTQSALHIFEWTLFAAILLVHTVLRYGVVRLVPDHQFGAAAIIDALLAAQVGLLVLWSILGPGRWFVHLFVAAGLLTAMFWMRAYDTYEGSASPPPWSSYSSDTQLRYWLLISEGVLLGVIFVVARCLGNRIDRASLLNSEQERTTRPRWSIKSLIVATAFGALAVKAGMIARTAWMEDSNTHALIAGVLLAVPTSSMFLLCLWTTLRPTDAFYRLMCVAPICGVLAFIIGVSLVSSYRKVIVPVLTLLGYEAVVAVATLLIVRLCGFRWLRPIPRIERAIEASPIVSTNASRDSMEASALRLVPSTDLTTR